MGSDLAMNPPREPARYCRTCKFWDRTGDAPSVDWSMVPSEVLTERGEGEEKRAFIERRAHTVERLYGTCTGVDFLLGAVDPAKAPLAFTQDASHYEALLYTRPEFGCALWRERGA